MAQQKTLVMLAAGEVAPNREDPLSIVEPLMHAFSTADIKFCQLEQCFTESGGVTSTDCPMRAHPRNASALRALGIDVASFASNHTMDYSHQGLFDTINTLRENGIATCGVGKNLDEARQPAIVERNGTRVAFLAYCTHNPSDYWAKWNRPGLAPLRAHTTYEPHVYYYPGTTVSIHTFPYPEDVKMIVEDIHRAKEIADVVAVSMHWGVHGETDYVLAEYQTEVGHIVLDEGADIILGTGSHAIKPLEVYKGKVIFYSLGNTFFDFGRKRGIDLREILPNWEEKARAMHWDLEPEWLDHYTFYPRSRKSIVGKCLIEGGKITQVSYLPLVINKYAVPRFVTSGEKEFDEVVSYVEYSCEGAKTSAKFRRAGDEIVIET